VPRAETAYFTPGLFRFLRELKANNDRDWFAANKDRYTALVEAPMIRFITDLGERFARVNPSFAADPRRTGGSMFRIYRDTRFSKDKTPFKTAASAHFRHRAAAKGESVPGFYLHLEPGRCIGGGGIYHPDLAALKRIRDRMVSEPAAWSRVRAKRLVLQGESLQRPPRGYDPDHRFAEDLKRKDLYVLEEYSEKDVCGPRFLETYVATCAKAGPLLDFLCGALGLARK
jgi:uncharacterized protein (TIGR02453 family)